MKTDNHPLFPPSDDDADSVVVEGIHVSRFENGNTPWCAYMFAPEELTSLQQISDLFGGGKYELVARANNKISAKRRYELAGRSKPLTMGGADADMPIALPAALPAPSTDLGLIMQLMQASQQSQMQMFQLMMQSQQSNTAALTTVLTAALGGASGKSDTAVRAVQENATAAMNNQTALFQTFMTAQAHGGGKDAVSALKEGIELGQLLKPNNGDGGGGDSVAETMGQVLEGLQMASKLAGEDLPSEEVLQ